jgi:hypothetical protein
MFYCTISYLAAGLWGASAYGMVVLYQRNKIAFHKMPTIAKASLMFMACCSFIGAHFFSQIIRILQARRPCAHANLQLP